MVRICIYYFAPQTKQIINASSVVKKMNFGYSKEFNDTNNFLDVQFTELSSRWFYAKKKIEKSYKNFDVILAVGENNELNNFAEIEMVAKKKKKIYNVDIDNFSNSKHLKKNMTYRDSNNYTCNDLNYFFLNKIEKGENIVFAFVHIPVNSSSVEEEGILKELERLIFFMQKKGTFLKKHKILAKIESEEDWEKGYTNVKKTCSTKGIYFPFKSLDMHEMTMEKTPINLDIIFLVKKNEDIVIKKISTAKAYSKKCVADLCYSVLEMPSPYCKINKVMKNHKIEIVNDNRA